MMIHSRVTAVMSGFILGTSYQFAGSTIFVNAWQNAGQVVNMWLDSMRALLGCAINTIIAS